MVLYQRFSVDGADYVYDTATSAIVRLPSGVDSWLDEIIAADAPPTSPREKAGERRAAATYVERAQRRSGLLVSRPDRDYRGILDPEYIRTRLDHGRRGLLLNVTDDCNQRCSYCIYSGKYDGQRSHSARRMSWDVARRSIDLFAAHRDDSRPVFISFYGGEPLLAWDLVRRCIDYVEDLDFQDPIVVLNTNLTLLDEAKAAFLAEHGTGLAVSLDGPAPIHDAARRLATGGHTQGTVVRWLEYLREHHRSYYDEKVVLQATFDRQFDVEQVFDFFCGETWRDLPITLAGIRLDDQSELRYDRATQVRHREALDNLVTRRARALESGEPFAHRLFAGLFRHVCKDIPTRQIGYAPSAAHPMRTCIPGVTRLYVDPQGDFYPCEKTNVPGAWIGDIDRGIQLGRVRHLLTRQVKFCEAECGRCWAWRFCDSCLAHFVERGRIRWRPVRRRCRDQRERIRLSLERFTYLYNHEPRSTWEHPFSLHRAVTRARVADRRNDG